MVEYSTWRSDSMYLPTRWMYPRFEYSGSVNAYIALNLLLVLNPCSRNVFLVPIAIYIWANVDRFKQQGHQVKVTEVKRCSFCTLQENKNVADLLRASKKQITIQAKLSCCYCCGCTMIWLRSTTCKNGVTSIVQCISQKKLQLWYLLHGTQ